MNDAEPREGERPEGSEATAQPGAPRPADEPELPYDREMTEPDEANAPDVEGRTEDDRIPREH